ncbi:MAG: hypothetical protein WBM32_22205, partial [Crocosphaera sp.]
ERPDLKELEIKTKYRLELIKVITTGIVVTLIPAIINGQIQGQIIENERLRVEKDYLTIFGDKFESLQKKISTGEVITDKEEILQLKRDYVEYLSIVAASKNSRERWESYLNYLNDKLTVIQQKDDKITENDQNGVTLRERINELENLATRNNDQEKKLNDLKKQLEKLEKDTEKLQDTRADIINREVRQVLPKISKPSTEIINSLISNFSGPKRRDSSNQLIDLYNNGKYKSQIIQGLFQAIDDNKNDYRVTLYVLRTLSKLNNDWQCDEQKKNSLQSLEKTDNYKDSTFKSRYKDAINKGQGCKTNGTS